MSNETFPTLPTQWETIVVFLQSEAKSVLDRALLYVLSLPADMGGEFRSVLCNALSEIRYTRSSKNDIRGKILAPLLGKLETQFPERLFSAFGQDHAFCQLMLEFDESVWAPNDPLFMTMIEHTSDVTRSNRRLMKKACTINHAALRFISHGLKNDHDFLAHFVQSDFQALQYVPEQMKVRYPDLVKTAVELFAASGWEGVLGVATPETLRPLVESFCEALPMDYFRYEYPRLDQVGRNNSLHWVKAGLPLPRAFDQGQDKDMLLHVAEHCQNYHEKMFAYHRFTYGTPLGSDKDFMLQSIKFFPALIVFAADDLMNDLDVLLEFFSAPKVFTSVSASEDLAGPNGKIIKASKLFKKKAQAVLDTDDYFHKAFLPLLHSNEGRQLAVSKLMMDPETTDATMTHILEFLDQMLPVDWKQKARLQRALDNVIDCGVTDPESDRRLMAPRKKKN